MSRQKKFSLKDDEARERVRSRLEVSLAVEAAAGTGKTTLMVERILNLIRSGRAGIEEIAAITFTEKAAGELLLRLRQELSALVHGERKDEASKEERDYLRLALDNLEAAQVSTIHALCTRMIRERPVEAGVDPDFEVLDELTQTVMFNELWPDWLRGAAERNPEPLKQALSIGAILQGTQYTRGIDTLVLELIRNRDLLLKIKPSDPEEVIKRHWPSLKKDLAAACALVESDCKSADKDACAGEVMEMFEVVSLAGESGEAYSRSRILRSELILGVKPKNNPAKNNWSSAKTQEEIAERRDGLRVMINRMLNEVDAAVMDNLLCFLKGFVDFWQAEKRRRGVVDFDDQLFLCRDMLRRNEGRVRAYFQDRYKAILVDEFQDTDPVQVETIFFLAEEGDEAGSWEEVKLGPGKLFVVGDPKQSIYRFRRADIEIYSRALEALQKSGGMALEIFQNFRTVPGIIDFVNRQFSELIREIPGTHYQPRYIALEGVRQSDEQHGPEAVIVLSSSEELQKKKPEAREQEARHVAGLIRHMLLSDEFLTFDKEKKEFRRLRKSDIGVLYAKHNEALEFLEEELLASDIAFVSDSGTGLFETQEVRDLKSALTAIDDPENELALVAALRSMLFGFSDTRLCELKAAGGGFDYRRKPAAGLEDFAEAMGLLHELHRKRNLVRPAELIEELIKRTSARLSYMARPHGGQAMANLRRIVELARNLERLSPTSFYAFVRHLGQMEITGEAEREAVTVEADDDFVRLTTIHKAKGLEFPVVILLDLAAERQGKGGPDILVDHSRGMLAAKLGSLCSSGYEELSERETARLEAERVRQFYVACTRARDYLVLPVFLAADSKSKNTYLDYLPEQMRIQDPKRFGKLEDRVLYFDPAVLDLEMKQPEKTKTMTADDLVDSYSRIRGQWLETDQKARAKAAEGQRIMLASQTERVTEENQEARISRAASIGSAVHEVMEAVDLGSREHLEELVKSAAFRKGLPEKTGEVLRLVKNILDSEPVRRAAAGGRYWREVPFSRVSDESLHEGVIDLIFEEQGKIVVVDYKTDRVSGPEMRSRAERYAGQQAMYAAAVQSAIGRAPSESILVFAHPGEWVRIGL